MVNADEKVLYEGEAGKLIDLTIYTINNIKFTQVWRGYDTSEADNFLDDLVRLAEYHKDYENLGNMIDSSSIKKANLYKGFRGYDCTEVNNFLGKIVLEFEKL